MNKDEVLKKLEKHKEESKDYSNYALMNEGYRAAMMDAIDLVKNLTIPVVMPRTSQDDYITLRKPTYLAKDGSIKMAREITNDIGETVRYEALKNDMYGA